MYNILGHIESISLILNFQFPYSVQDLWYFITLEWQLKEEIETFVEKFDIVNLTMTRKTIITLFGYFFKAYREHTIAELNDKKLIF